MANLSALRAAVFSLSAKNLTGGLKSTPPPPVRGLILTDSPVSINTARAALILPGPPVSINTDRAALILPEF